MKIAETYSHLNGVEWLIVHAPKLWNEVRYAIYSVNAAACMSKVSN